MWDAGIESSDFTYWATVLAPACEFFEILRLIHIIQVVCDSLCPGEYGTAKAEFSYFMACFLLSAVTTEDASVLQKQSTEDVEPTVELLPVEFQVRLSYISLL